MVGVSRYGFFPEVERGGYHGIDSEGRVRYFMPL